jgi:hypothetical protein
MNQRPFGGVSNASAPHFDDRKCRVSNFHRILVAIAQEKTRQAAIVCFDRKAVSSKSFRDTVSAFTELCQPFQHSAPS